MKRRRPYINFNIFIGNKEKENKRQLIEPSDIVNNFDELFKESLDNTFSILIGETTYPEMIASDPDTFFFFDPREKLTKEDLRDLIHLFEQFEDYEKCGELMNLMVGLEKKPTPTPLNIN
jgi:hypothetical protein